MPSSACNSAKPAIHSLQDHQFPRTSIDDKSSKTAVCPANEEAVSVLASARCRHIHVFEDQTRRNNIPAMHGIAKTTVYWNVWSFSGLILVRPREMCTGQLRADVQSCRQA